MVRHGSGGDHDPHREHDPHSGQDAPGPPDEPSQPTGPAEPPGDGGGGADGGDSGAPASPVRLIAGDYLLTINPVDGSEIEPCPPAELPAAPSRLPQRERPAPEASTVPSTAGGLPLPLLEREEEREQLGRLLAHGRSVRLTGPAGSGRTALLDAVAADVAELAPDGVVRLSGYRRTPDDLLHELFATTHRAPPHRPASAELDAALQTVGAIVVLDDLEFGGAALDELRLRTPDCAFLLAATGDIAAPSAASHTEEIHLPGLSRTGCLELLEHTVRRPLTHAETDWAADLWFETEGLPLRFLQAGALLRQYDAASTTLPADGGTGPSAQRLPALIAAQLPEAAREVLRFAVALDGELPHRGHLPALTGDQRAETALPQLLRTGLVSTAGGHLRLAHGVAEELTAAGYAEDADARAQLAAQHYTWWAGHPSVAAERVGAEADAMLAAVEGARRSGQPSAAVLLARTAAPALAAALRWDAWEGILRSGQEAARVSGEVAEQSYFHHELGVLALSTGDPERARGELEAAISLRGSLADQRGTVAGRRALALVTDQLNAAAGAWPAAAQDTGGNAAGDPAAPSEQSPGAAAVPAETERRPGEVVAPPPGVLPAAPAEDDTDTLVTDSGASRGAAAASATVDGGRPAHGRHSARHGAVRKNTRRNVLAAGVGAALVAAVGAVVTLGYTSDDGGPADTVRPEQSASQGEEDDGMPAEKPQPTRDGGSSPPAGQDQRTSPPDSSAPPSDSEAPSSPEDSPTSPSDSPSSPDDPPSSPDDPPSSPDDPPSSPDDPPSSPDDPPSSPDDPPSSPDDPPSSPDNPPSSPDEDSPSASTAEPEASPRALVSMDSRSESGSAEPQASP